MHAEVRMARIDEAIGRNRGGSLSRLRAAELLGMGEPHFRRLRDGHRAEGAEGLIDRRRGKASGRRAPADMIEWVLDQYRTRYFGFTTRHFHEALRSEKQAFTLSYTGTKTLLEKRGVVGIAKGRSAHRKKRVRKARLGRCCCRMGRHMLGCRASRRWT